MVAVEKMQEKLRKMARRNPALMYAIKKADNAVKNMSQEDMKKELEAEGIDAETLQSKKIMRKLRK